MEKDLQIRKKKSPANSSYPFPSVSGSVYLPTSLWAPSLIFSVVFPGFRRKEAAGRLKARDCFSYRQYTPGAK